MSSNFTYLDAIIYLELNKLSTFYLKSGKIVSYFYLTVVIPRFEEAHTCLNIPLNLVFLPKIDKCET